MPYYWRRPYYRRPRRFWRRRARKTFRTRRRWRRRRNWVRRPRKLKKITVQQWQPTKIQKLKVFGYYPLFEGTNLRIGNDNTQYIDSTAPYLVPGGGLYSITVFTLKGLYELHLKARNWWTKSNCKMPLIRYMGCKILLYRSYEADYVTVYARCGNLVASEQLYQSSQPYILTLNKHHKIVKCTKSNKNKKPYKVLRIPPPTMMENKWYFQRDIINIPLVMLITSAMSLDRFYIPSNSISSTIGFKSLNTTLFQYHDFKKRLTTPYKPNDEYYLFTVHINTTWNTAKGTELILLGNTEDWTPGEKIGDTSLDTYFSTKTKWGNPFYSPYFGQEGPPILILKAANIQEVKQKLKNLNTQTIPNLGLTETTKSTYLECRYNPQSDMAHNAIFLANIFTDHHKWETPKDEKVQTKGLPLWLLTFGWLDWIEKSQSAQHKDTDYCLCIVSDYIEPKLDYYVPLDFNFLHGKSPYETQEGHIKPYDLQNWHPKLNFQQESIAHIINTGPGTIKLPDKISAEAHMKYIFYFKLGGCPPPMDDVCDPQKQPTWPIANNIISPTLLQNPEYPPEYYLYTFDQRREMLTERAAKRLKTDTGFKETFFKPTGETTLSIKHQTPETSSDETEEEEKGQETLQLQLQHQHKQQRKLRRRIIQLLNLLQK
nr:MAG: ORF1 [TTV-like mini virus]